MNKEQQELLDEAYVNYVKEFEKDNTIGYKMRHKDSNGNRVFNVGTKEIFINKCKTDSEFSEKWGLKIEERELSDEESIFHYEKELYSPLRIIDPKIPVIPTKLITITYNNKTIESYE